MNPDDMQVGPTYQTLLHQIRGWQSRYPATVVPPIGYSVLAQPLHSFRIGKGNVHIHLNAAMHANEWLTAFALTRLGTRLSHLWTYPFAKRTIIDEQWLRLLERCSLWLVPLVNPDGVQLVMDGWSAQHPNANRLLEWNGGSTEFAGWKANIRGVDLNDQFPAGWREEQSRRQAGRATGIGEGNEGAGPRDFGGKFPLSEPEARALADFAMMRSFATVFAVHSQGEEIYYNYRGFEPPCAEPMARQMAAAAGYRAVCLQDSDAGFKDWFIRQFRRPGFTLEIGKGCNPLPRRQLQTITIELERMVQVGLRHLLETNHFRKRHKQP